MICDLLTNSSTYVPMHPMFLLAFGWLQNTGLQQIKPGRYAIAGDDVFALVSEYETKALPEGCSEAHQLYIDIQVLIQGEELIGWEPLTNQELLKPYRADTDIAFYKGEPALFKLSEGLFAVFFPSDLHMPCISNGNAQPVKKVVIKVKV